MSTISDQPSRAFLPRALFIGGVVLFILFVFGLLFLYFRASDLERRLSILQQQAKERPVPAVPSTSDYQYVSSQVGGLFLAYQPCEECFTGSCDDVLVYRLTDDGSKEVIISSVRALSFAPRTTELLQPVFKDPEDRWLLLRAWAFGSSAPDAKDAPVWVYDFKRGDVALQFTGIPFNAIFSPDFSYAAFMDENKSVRVVHLRSGSVVRDILPTEGQDFLGTGTLPVLRWVDSQTLSIKDFSVTSTQDAAVLIPISS